MLNFLLRNKLCMLAATTCLSLATSNTSAHSGPLNEIAVKACDAKARSEACQYEGMHNDLYVGSCQYMSTTLMCVRNQPIQEIEPKQSETLATHTHD